nr:MAG TPA: hypothetical protein [Caudoviricetes sp.]
MLIKTPFVCRIFLAPTRCLIWYNHRLHSNYIWLKKLLLTKKKEGGSIEPPS